MLERLKHMIIKEFIQVLRDRRMRVVIFIAPIFQLIIFGYAVNTDVRHVTTAILDRDNTPESRELISRFHGSDCFQVSYVNSEIELQNSIDRGKARAGILINNGFAQDLKGNRTSSVQLILDGSDSNTAGIVVSYAGGIASKFNKEVLFKRMAKGGGGKLQEPVVLEPRTWFNENLESRNFFLPGVIAQIVMIISVILSSMSIVREREMGTMEQIMVTPIGRLEFILGKTLPFASIGFLNVAVITIVAVFWFHIPLLGSLWILFLSTGLFLASTLGLGLFISTISNTQQQAMLTAVFFVMPAMLLSGFNYPIANMPECVQWLTFLNPLRYFLVITRGIFLKGVGLNILWPQVLALSILGVAGITLSATRLRKTMQ